MIYQRVQEELFPRPETEKNNRISEVDAQQGGKAEPISYRVFEGKDCAAEFTCHVQRLRGSEDCRFRINGIRLFSPYATVSVMEAVLLFLQYKAKTLGCRDMVVTLDPKNLFYRELYQRFGFYLIDQPEQEEERKETQCACVLKYPLPGNREEQFSDYIMRREREKARKPL